MEEALKSIGSELVVEIIKLMIVGTLSAWIATKLSLKRFFAEKIWERKLDAYTNIFNALYNMKRYCEDVQSVVQMDGPEAVQDAQDSTLKRNYFRAIEDILKTIEVGGFIVSEDTIKNLQNLEAHLREDEWVEHVVNIENQLGTVNNCIKTQLEIVLKRI